MDVITGSGGPGCWLIRGSRLLHDLETRTTELLARHASVGRYRRGEYLQQAGEPMASVWFINSGRVKLSRISRDGKQQAVGILGPGDALGLIGVVDGAPQELHAEALTAVDACIIPAPAFLAMLQADASLALRFAEAMGEKLNEAREMIADLVFRDVRSRVAHALLVLLAQDRRSRGEAGDARGRVGFELGLTHRDIGELVGTRRESVTAALADLQRAGIIEVNGRDLWLETDALRELTAL